MIVLGLNNWLKKHLLLVTNRNANANAIYFNGLMHSYLEKNENVFCTNVEDNLLLAPLLGPNKESLFLHLILPS